MDKETIRFAASISEEGRIQLPPDIVSKVKNSPGEIILEISIVQPGAVSPEEVSAIVAAQHLEREHVHSLLEAEGIARRFPAMLERLGKL